MLRQTAIAFLFSALCLPMLALSASARDHRNDPPPEPRKGTGQGSSLMAAYTPPDNGGPAKSGGSGTRLM